MNSKSTLESSRKQEEQEEADEAEDEDEEEENEHREFELRPLLEETTNRCLSRRPTAATTIESVSEITRHGDERGRG